MAGVVNDCPACGMRLYDMEPCPEHGRLAYERRPATEPRKRYLIAPRAQVMADAAMGRLGERLHRDDSNRCWRAVWSDNSIHNQTSIHLTIFDAGMAELKIVRRWKRGAEPPGPFTTVRADDIGSMIDAAESYVGGPRKGEDDT